MTDEELQAIRERAEKATPGPWEANEVGLYVIAPLARGKESIARMPYPYGDTSDNQSNAAFIAHARTDIPALLAEVERLRRAIEIAHDNHAVTLALWEAAKAENAALREIVQAVADSDAVTSRDHGLTVACEWCGGRLNTDYSVVEHTDNCVYTKARALMASEETD